VLDGLRTRANCKIRKTVYTNIFRIPLAQVFLLPRDFQWIRHGCSAPAFFLHCYDLRSELVHGGNIRDAHEQANGIAAALAVLFPTYSWRDLRAVQV
jgi:hypothetical protein